MGEVKKLLDEHISGSWRWHDQLWNLLMLELWHETFIDNRPQSITVDRIKSSA
jgi:hypothetical protein